MREEIWTEKIFKDDAGYFLRITKSRASPLESWDCNDETVPFMWLHERHG